MATRNTRLFTDLDLNFQPHPATKDIGVKNDEQAVKASIRNLVMTTNYERPFHPEIGSPLKALLFENATPLLPILIERAIRQTIENFEPRANLTRVTADLSEDTNSVYVTVEFKILNTATPQVVTLILNRTR